MLQDFAREDEIVPAVIAQVGMSDVERGRLIVKGIGVIEFFREAISEVWRVAHPDCADALEDRKFGKVSSVPKISFDRSAMRARTRTEDRQCGQSSCSRCKVRRGGRTSSRICCK